MYQSSLSLLWLLLACSESGTSKNRTPPADPIVADASGAYTLTLDEPGGEKGAPRGMAFHFPPGAPVDAKIGTLSEGGSGFHFGVPEEGTSVVCTQPLPVTGPITIQTRMKVVAIEPGPQKFMGLTVELRTRDAGGNLISPATGRYSVAGVFREAGDWQDVVLTATPPSGGSTGEVCYRFVRSSGTVEVDSITVSPGLSSVVTNAPEPVGEGEKTCPEGCCPCEAAVPGVVSGEGEKGGGVSPGKTEKKGVLSSLPIRWALDLVGGKNGASKGFEFVAAKEGPATKVAVIKEKGLQITTTTPDKSTVCSEKFSSASRLIIKGNISILDYKSAGKNNSGFVVELRSFDANNKLVSPAKVQFQRLFVGQTVFDSMDFSKDVSPPDAAVSSRICVRFTEASGQAVLSWLGVYPG